MPNLAMRQPGTLFVGDGVDLSWPIGGDREVIAVDEDKMSLRIRRQIAEGHIAIVDDKPTKKAEGDAREYKLLTGEEARKVFDEPAGPVTRVIYEPVEFEEHTVESAMFDPLSERAKKSMEAAAKAAEENSQAIAKRQAAAEKQAAKEASEAKPEEEVPDPIAERMKQSLEAQHEAALEADKAFMEKETERQKLESETPTFEPDVAPEPDTKEAEAKAAAAEKARQAKEKDADKTKAADAKKAAAAEKASADTQASLSEPTPVEAPKPGETPKSKGGQPKS